MTHRPVRPDPAASTRWPLARPRRTRTSAADVLYLPVFAPGPPFPSVPVDPTSYDRVIVAFSGARIPSPASSPFWMRE